MRLKSIAWAHPTSGPPFFCNY